MKQVRQSLHEETNPGSSSKKRKGVMRMNFMHIAEERHGIQAGVLFGQSNMEGSDEEEADGKTVAAPICRWSFSGGAV